MHDLIDITLGLICGACGWLIVRLVGHVDDVEERVEAAEKNDIRTNAAIRRVEEFLKIEHYPISD